MTAKNMIIGLTGKMAAGKGTVAGYLVEQGYVYHSLSDVLRGELERRGVPESIPNLIDVGNELRTIEGPGVLGKRILKMIQDADENKALADSIRHPAEIQALRHIQEFYLIGVDAPQAIRYKRMAARGRSGDEMTFDQFQENDKQLKSDDPNSQQILDCLKQADYTIVNEGSLDELRQKIDSILKEMDRSAK